MALCRHQDLSPFAITVVPDLLDQFTLDPHPFRRLPPELDRVRTIRPPIRPRQDQLKPSQWGQIRPSFPHAQPAARR